jgi:GTP-binding protein YchF
MKDVAIVGLPQSGKSTIFTAVSRHVAQRGSASQAVVDVPDERIDKLAEIYESKKKTLAQVNLVDVPGMDSYALQSARVADALAVVLRAFGDAVDVARDLASFRADLAVADLTTVEKVAERAARKAKSGDATAKLEVETCERAERVLSEGHWLWDEDWSDEQRRVISMWTPLTYKPVLHVVNAEDPEFDATSVPEPHVVICGALEAEATELPEDEAATLLREFGITDLAAGRFVRAAYDAIGLITFFTAGPTEAHAWAVRKGAKAPQAAGAIHSDFERAFIRAERVGYDDIVELGSEDAARQRGLLRAEGKEYEVREGDVLLILHSA